MDQRYKKFICLYTHQQLAGLYGVSWATLWRWLRPHKEELGKKNGHFFMPRQVRWIVGKYGPPKAWVIACQG